MKFDEIEKKNILAYRENMGSFELLYDGNIKNIAKLDKVLIEDPTIEEIMLILTKGENYERFNN